jgi:hypothetical protein
MQALGPGAFRQELADAGCKAAGHPECQSKLPGIEAQCDTCTGRSSQHADNADGMETRFMDGPRNDVIETANHLHAGDYSAQGVFAGEMEPFGCCEHSGKNHRAHADGGALQRVVKVLAVRRRSVDQSCAGSIEGTSVANCGALAFTVPAIHQRGDVIGLSSGNAQAGHVDQIVDRHFLCLHRDIGKLQVRKYGRNFLGKGRSLEADGVIGCGGVRHVNWSPSCLRVRKCGAL